MDDPQELVDEVRELRELAQERRERLRQAVLDLACAVAEGLSISEHGQRIREYWAAHTVQWKAKKTADRRKP
jgi:hypothetical protein